MFRALLTAALVLAAAPATAADPPKTLHKTAKVGDLDVFYREAGPKDAPAVLLLHGFPTSSQMFRDLIPKLADKYRVVAPDYPGFGHSSMPPRDKFRYTFDNLADVVEQFTEKVGLTSSGFLTPCVYCHFVASYFRNPRRASRFSLLAGSFQYALIGFQKSLSRPSS